MAALTARFVTTSRGPDRGRFTGPGTEALRKCTEFVKLTDRALPERGPRKGPLLPKAGGTAEAAKMQRHVMPHFFPAVLLLPVLPLGGPNRLLETWRGRRCGEGRPPLPADSVSKQRVRVRRGEGACPP